MDKKSFLEQIQIANIIHSVTDLGITLLHNHELVVDIYITCFEKKLTTDTLLKNSYIVSNTFTPVLQEVKTNDFIFYFLVTNIPCIENTNSTLIIGPFSLHNLKQTFLNKSAHLPILTEDKLVNLKKLIVNLIQNPLILSSNINIICKNNHLPINYEPTENEITSIEIRYKEQAKLKHVIMSGNIEEAKKLADQFENFYILFKDRMSENPLRIAKNTAIIGNTYERLSAEEAGVHPFYLDKISEYYSIQIEKCKNATEVESLGKNMLIDYCRLVKRSSSKNHSPNIRKIIDYIYVNLNRTFSLDELSQHIHLNKTYMCTIFKNETNETLTQFINKLRISDAKHLLKNTDLTLSEISSQLGYNNYSYFSQVFKKEVGVSPRNYRKL